MPALRTTLLAAGLGAAALATTALVATSATAAPAPVAAVEQLTAVRADTATAGDTASDGSARTKARGWWKGLTDAQRACLQDQGITRPVGPLDDAERTALRTEVEAAAKTCDVTLPLAGARAFWGGLTDEQRACLKDAGVNRPWGPLTTQQRQAVRTDLRAAAETCGVSLPTATPGRE